MQIISTPSPSLSCQIEGIDGRTQWESSSRACKPPLIKLPSHGCLEAHGHAVHSSELPQGLASPGGTRLLLSGVLPFAEQGAGGSITQLQSAHPSASFSSAPGRWTGTGASFLGSLHRCPLCHPPARTTCIGHTAEGAQLTQLQNDKVFWEALQIYSHLFPQRTCCPCARHLAAPQADGREGHLVCPHLGCPCGWARGAAGGTGGWSQYQTASSSEGRRERGWGWWEECRLLPTGHGLYWNSHPWRESPLASRIPRCLWGGAGRGSVLALLLSLGLGAAGPVSQVSEAAPFWMETGRGRDLAFLTRTRGLLLGVSIAWELVRNADSQPHSRPTSWNLHFK